jgi:hypothetical protein
MKTQTCAEFETIFVLNCLKNTSGADSRLVSMSTSMLSSVVEPKFFVSVPAFKKFRLWLRVQLCNYLFAQLLNLK